MNISDDLAELSQKMLCTCQHFKAEKNVFHFLTDLLLSLRNRQKKMFVFHAVGNIDDVVARPPSQDSSYIVKYFVGFFSINILHSIK